MRKKGESQCVGFVASFIDDSFIPGGERLLEPVAALLGELVCDPATERGRFVSAYFESEKTNLIDAIRSIINDKRDYADSRLLQTMCAGEAYGIPRLGSEEGAERLQLRKLYAQYGRLIASSRLELFYSGSADRRRVEDALLSAFATLPRENIRETCERTPASLSTRTDNERLSICILPSQSTRNWVMRPPPGTMGRTISSISIAQSIT